MDLFTIKTYLAKNVKSFFYYSNNKESAKELFRPRRCPDLICHLWKQSSLYKRTLLELQEAPWQCIVNEVVRVDAVHRQRHETLDERLRIPPPLARVFPGALHRRRQYRRGDHSLERRERPEKLCEILQSDRRVILT